MMFQYGEWAGQPGDKGMFVKTGLIVSIVLLAACSKPADVEASNSSDNERVKEQTTATPNSLASQAFAAAFAQAEPATVTFPEKTLHEDGYDSVSPEAKVRFRAGILLQIGPKWVLISVGEELAPTHGSPGMVAVHYLTRRRDGFSIDRSYLPLIEAGSMGQIAEWSISKTLSKYPVLYVEGSFGNMGVTCSWANLAELTPSGPVLSPAIQTYFTDGGSNSPVYPQGIEGKIAKVVRDKSFVMRFSGDDNFEEEYVKRGNKFVIQSGESKLEGC